MGRKKPNVLAKPSSVSIDPDNQVSIKEALETVQGDITAMCPASAMVVKHPDKDIKWPQERYNKENVLVVLRCLAMGMTQEAAASFIGVTPDTVGRWKSVHKDFGMAVDKAKNLNTLVLLGYIYKGLDKHPKLALDLLERVNPKEYAQTKRVEQSGSIQHQHGPTAMLRNLQQQREKVDAIELPSTSETIDIKAIEEE